MLNTKIERDEFLEKLSEDANVNDSLLEWGGKLALENCNYILGERFFSSLIERRKNGQDYIGLATSLFHQDCLKESAECLFEALKHISNPCQSLFIIYKNLGDIYFKLDDLLLSEEYYNKAYTIYPDSNTLKMHVGLLYLKQKEYTKAENKFKSILISNLESYQSWFGLAVIRKHKGEDELAKASLYRSMDFNPKYKPSINLDNQWKKEGLDIGSLKGFSFIK